MDYDRTWYNSDGTEGVIVVWEMSSSAGYDWWCDAIVLNSRGEYAFYSDSGCSCNMEYEMGWDEYDLAWTTDVNEVKRQARESVGGRSQINVGRKAENLSKLSRLTKGK